MQLNNAMIKSKHSKYRHEDKHQCEAEVILYKENKKLLQWSYAFSLFFYFEDP